MPQPSPKKQLSPVVQMPKWFTHTWPWLKIKSCAFLKFIWWWLGLNHCESGVKFMESIPTRRGNFEDVFSWSFKVVQTFLGNCDIGGIFYSQVVVIQCPCFLLFPTWEAACSGMCNNNKECHCISFRSKFEHISTSIDNNALLNKMFRKARRIFKCVSTRKPSPLPEFATIDHKVRK